MVSILIPAYNAERWIGQALESARNQTWARTEVVVVDDGSTDGTHDVAKRFAAANIKVVTQPNQGASAARNQAYRLCQGDYIQWLDADNLLDPGKIAAQMQFVRQDHDPLRLLSSGWGRFFYRHRKARFVATSLWQDLAPVDWFINKMRDSAWMVSEVWLMSRTLAERAGPWDAAISTDDDGEYFSRVIQNSTAVVFAPASRSYYRTVDFGSLSNMIHRSARHQDSQWQSMQLQIARLRQLEDSPRTRAAALQYLHSWAFFFSERPDVLRQMAGVAEALGGTLQPPDLARKYALLQRLFGWDVARRGRLMAPMLKTRLRANWDKACFAWEGRRAPDAGAPQAASRGPAPGDSRA